MTDLVNKQPWFRARDALQFIEWYTELAVRQCTLAVHVLPEEVLADREALTGCLAKELRDLGCHQSHQSGRNLIER